MFPSLLHPFPPNHLLHLSPYKHLLRVVFSTSTSTFSSSSPSFLSVPKPERRKMSLFVPGTGLLGSNVSWSFVEESLQRAFGTTATLGPNRSISCISEGKGFLSLVGVVTCDWRGTKGLEKLPKLVALKMPSGLASIEAQDAVSGEAFRAAMEGALREFHNYEVEFYRNSGGWQNATCLLPIPQCYYAIPFDVEHRLDAHIAMALVDDVKSLRFEDNLTIQQAKQVAHTLGFIQAFGHLSGFSKSEELKDRRILHLFWMAQSITSYADMTKKLLEIDHKGILAKPIADFLAILPSLYGTTRTETYHEDEGLPPVLCHGDFWQGNMLFCARHGHAKAMLDWQNVHPGSPSEDILRLLLTCLSGADRRARQKELLDTLYSGMVRALNGVAPPYSREELEAAYCALLPHVGVLVIVVAIHQCEKDRRSGCSSDDFTAGDNQAAEKLAALYEDIVYYHKHQPRQLPK